jgi:plastocyanin
MHTAALHLAPILGAEKSKVPFYVAGALLVAWALIVSLGLGLRRPDFPPTESLERAVIAVTVVLVLAAASTAVITSGSAAKAGAETGSAQATPKAESTSAAAPPAPASTPARQPKATTGAPAAPSAPAPSATTSLKLLANPEGMLSFDTKQLSAKAGTVTIALTNNAPLEHDVTVVQGSTVLAKTPTFRGGSRTLTVKLKPGSYTFYCSVPGHRQAGMEGTLSVS